MALEERKIQLGVAVDATDAKSGFNEVKQSAREMATSVSAEGGRAARSIDSLGNGSGAAAQKLDASTRSIITSIQRTTATAEAGERGTRKFFESLASQRGVDVGALKPYLDQLDAVTSKQKVAGVSAGQTAAALRQVPAQFTDIVVSLQAGQAPLTVLLQQGGQLKDAFGGAVPAVQAIGGYIAGLISPATVAAAAIGTLVFATLQAESAQRVINGLTVQLEATGRTSLASSEQIKALVNEMARIPGVSKAAAREVVGEFAKAPAIGVELFKELALSVQDFARATGTDAAGAAKTLANAFSDPAKGAQQLDEALGTLKASQILAIEELVRLGDKAGAQRALLDALRESVGGLAKEAVTPLEAATKDLSNAWDGAMSSFSNNQGLRATNSLLTGIVEKVTALINFANTPGRFSGGLNGIVMSALGLGGEGAAGAAGVPPMARPPVPFTGGASGSWGPSADQQAKDVLRGTASYKSSASRAGDIKDDIQQINDALARLKKTGTESGPVVDELRGRLAGAQEALGKIGKSGAAAANRVARSDLKADLQGLKDDLAGVVGEYGRAEKLLEAQRAAGLLDEGAYYAAKRQFVQQAAAAKVAEIGQENARMRSQKATGAERIDLDRQIEQNIRRRTEIEKDATNQSQILAVQETAANNARVASYLAARQAAESLLKTQARRQDRDIASLGQGDRTREYNAGRNQLDDYYDAQRLQVENTRRLLEAEGRFNPQAKEKYDRELALIEEFQGKAVQLFDGYWQQRVDGEANASLGASRAVANYFENARDVARQTEGVFTNAFTGMEDALVRFTTSGKLDFKSLATSIIADLARMQIKAQATKLFSSNSGLIGDLLGKSIGGTYGTATQAGLDGLIKLVASAKGNVFDSPGLSAYSSTIVSRPTVFPFAKGVGLMGEAGPEAIIPLRRGSDGRLGVSAPGGSGGQVIFSPTTTINVDSRSDRAAVIADVQQVVGESQKRYTQELQRIGVVPA